MMYQIKRLTWDPGDMKHEPNGIEAVVNNWMREHPEYKIQNVQMSTDVEYFKGTMYIALITYITEEGKND